MYRTLIRRTAVTAKAANALREVHHLAIGPQVGFPEVGAGEILPSDGQSGSKTGHRKHTFPKPSRKQHAQLLILQQDCCVPSVFHNHLVLESPISKNSLPDCRSPRTKVTTRAFPKTDSKAYFIYEGTCLKINAPEGSTPLSVKPRMVWSKPELWLRRYRVKYTFVRYA